MDCFWQHVKGYNIQVIILSTKTLDLFVNFKIIKIKNDWPKCFHVMFSFIKIAFLAI